MDTEDLFDHKKFYVYFPCWTIGGTKKGGVRHPIFDPAKHCDVQPIGHSKWGGCFPLFTDEILAEDAVRFLAKNGQPTSYVMRMEHHEHLKTLLQFYQHSGMKYVGTDWILEPRPSVYIRPIEVVIDACDRAEPYGQDGH